MQALIIVKGDYSEGTGFVAKMHDHYFIVTNQHVLAGNKQFTLTGADGTKYPTTGAMFGARNYDVAIIQIPDALAKYFLEIDSDPLTNTKTHSPVTVPGNADGTGVPVQIDGQLLGIGPTKIEVSAKFVHGNSGSPIIYRPTGKVIGIATEVIITSMDEVKKAANASPDHWIGFRLDNIPSDTGWVKLDWNLFSAQGLQMQKVEDAGDFLEQFFTSDKLPATDNPQILAAIRELHRNADTNVAQGDAENLVWSVKTFVGQVQKLAEDNMKSLGTQNLYPYFANELQEEQDLWVDLDKAIADGNKQAGDLMTQVLDLK